MLQKQWFGGTVDVVPQARLGGAFATLTIDAEYRCDFHITFVFKSWRRPRERITPHRDRQETGAPVGATF